MIGFSMIRSMGTSTISRSAESGCSTTALGMSTRITAPDFSPFGRKPASALSISVWISVASSAERGRIVFTVT